VLCSTEDEKIRRELLTLANELLVTTTTILLWWK